MDSTQRQRSIDSWNKVPVPERVARRAVENIDVDESGCWISLYSVGSHGYAQIGWSARGKNHMVLAHRAAWTSVNGQVPMGVTLDHICKVRRCVNPEHLRIMSNFENSRRVNGRDAPMGQCLNGHSNSELVSVARRTKSGQRRYGLTCGICLRGGQEKYRLRKFGPRGRPLADINREKTHCLRGHPLAGDNLVAYELARGKRVCKTCKATRQKVYRGSRQRGMSND